MAFTNTRTAVPLKLTPVKSTLRILDGGPLLLICGRTFHTEPRDRPHTVHTGFWFLASGFAATEESEWAGKEVIKHLREESWGCNWEGKSEKQERRLLPDWPVHHSLKRTHYHLWTVYIVIIVIIQPVITDHKDSLLDFFEQWKSCLFSPRCSLIETTTWLIKHAAVLFLNDPLLAWVSRIAFDFEEGPLSPQRSSDCLPNCSIWAWSGGFRIRPLDACWRWLELAGLKAPYPRERKSSAVGHTHIQHTNVGAVAALSHAGAATRGALEYRLSSSLSSFTKTEEDSTAPRSEATLLNSSEKRWETELTQREIYSYILHHTDRHSNTPLHKSLIQEKQSCGGRERHRDWAG